MWAERDKRGVREFLYFGRYTLEVFLNLGICRAWTKNTWENIFSKLAFFKSASYFVPTTPFSLSHLEAFGLLSYDCCVVAFRYRISRPNPFVRGFVVEGGRSLPDDIITPSSVRADSSSYGDTT